MEKFDTSALPIETREWLERKAAASGCSSPIELAEKLVCRFHELDAADEASIEAKLLERLEAPATDMTEDDWSGLRKKLRER